MENPNANGNLNEVVNEDFNANSSNLKQRHGCVTAWLILMIVINSLTSIAYFFAGDMIARSLPNGATNTVILFLGVVGLANVIFACLLFNWMKLGFWGFLATTIIALSINIYIGLGIGQSLLGLIGIGILYGILQIKQNNVTAWNNLE